MRIWCASPDPRFGQRSEPRFPKGIPGNATRLERQGDDMATQSGDALTEVAKVKETAERLAKGQAAAGADQIRVLAGLIHQLAEQVERMVDVGAMTPMGTGPNSPRPR
jgi:hypothetical protein